MKKFLCVLLTALMLLPAFAGCSEQKKESSDPASNGPATTGSDPAAAETEPEETALPDNLPEKKFDGYTFTASAHSEQIGIEEETGEVLNDALFQRDLVVENRFDVKLVTEKFDDYTPALEALKRSVTAGTDDYDCGFIHMVSASSAASAGFFYSLDELGYIDPTKPWWDTDCVDAFTVAGHMKLLCGMLLPNAMLRSSCMVFNKNRFDDHGLEYPYSQVDAGEWTLDALYEITKDTTRDVNGDGEIKETDDFYGLTQWYLDSPYSFYYGAGGTIVTKDADGVPVLNRDLERNTAIYEKIYKVVIDNNSNYHTDIATYGRSYDTFNEGRALFCEASLSHLKNDGFREMEDDYGVLPIPKYDAGQSQYMSFVNGAVSMLVVPSVCPDPERTGILLEGLASESWRNVYDALFEITAKSKSARDPDSSRMMDLVMANRVFDLGYSHLYSQGWVQFVRDLLASRSTDVASMWAKNEKIMNKMLEKVIEAYEKNNE